MTRHLTLALLVLAVGCAPAFAATMSVSTTAPTVDGADIAQLVGTSDAGGDQGHFWSNRPDQGQTFTTGPNAAGYSLSAVSLLARVDQGGGTTSPNWEVRVGSVSGTNVFGAEYVESAVGVAIPNASTSGNPPLQWVTWALGAPALLAPNSVYGFDLYPDGSGFISMNNPGDVYAGGTAISNDDNLPASPPNALTLRGVDRVFHVDLDPAGEIPEPATCALATFAFAALGGYVRKRRKA